jgi:hypothetical protein
MDQEVRDAIEDLKNLVSCRCHPAFKDRGLHDPECMCDYKESVDIVKLALEIKSVASDEGGKDEL